MERGWIALGALSALVAVALAAVAAHALPQRLDAARLAMAQSAIRMQGWHALALLFIGLWAPRGGALAQAAGACFALGTLLFCGAVWALAVAEWRIGPVAPAGGLLLMLGWALLALSALRAA